MGHRANNLPGDEGEALLDVVGQYARSWRILLQYDENRLPAEPAHPTRKTARLTLLQASKFIVKLKASLVAQGSASALFGSPRGHRLEGVLAGLRTALAAIDRTDAERGRLVGEIVGYVGGREDHESDRQHVQHAVVALEGRDLAFARPVRLEGDLGDVALVGPAGGDALGARGGAAIG